MAIDDCVINEEAVERAVVGVINEILSDGEQNHELRNYLSNYFATKGERVSSDYIYSKIETRVMKRMAKPYEEELLGLIAEDWRALKYGFLSNILGFAVGISGMNTYLVRPLALCGLTILTLGAMYAIRTRKKLRKKSEACKKMYCEAKDKAQEFYQSLAGEKFKQILDKTLEANKQNLR